MRQRVISENWINIITMKPNPMERASTTIQALETCPIKKLPVVIATATCFAAFYHMTPIFGFPAGLIVFLFLLSHFIVLHMAYVILKYGTPSKETFEDKFYEDSLCRRVRPTAPPVAGHESL